MSSSSRRSRAGILGVLTALVLATAAPAAADTLLMPTRDYLMNTSEVVWGVTTLPNTTPFVLDYGDGNQTSGNVVDQSYIAFNHTYATFGAFTVQLCVGDTVIACGALGAELTSVVVNVFDGTALSAAALRGLNINRSIQDGLRWLWTSQDSRAANFPGGVTTSWTDLGGWGLSVPVSQTSLAVLAFQNHGYLLPNSNAAPTGLYERFIVQRGLNYVASQLSPVTLSVQPAGDPCAGVGSDCQGFFNPDNGASDTGYSTALAALPFAGSNALSRLFAGLPAGNNAGYPNGRSFGEMLQRLSNTIVWGQHDEGGGGGGGGGGDFNAGESHDGSTCTGRGGWYYTFSDNQCQTSDGSTVGWDVLALLDAAAAGAVVPLFAKTEFETALEHHTNNDGSFDYGADDCDTCYNWANIAKAGVGLEAAFWVGDGPGLFDDYIASVWSTGGSGGSCNAGQNLGCAYDMFNAFKGLKLHGITTLPGIGVPAGPGYGADDWYAAYVNWLVANQTAPTTVGGGLWGSMDFSCCFTGTTKVSESAVALLILSPVALIQPDPTLFATIGLSQTSNVNRPGTQHTVTATALSSSKSPIPGVTIDFDVLTGPNAGQSGQGVTDANGQTTFTYTDTSVAPWPKSDTIQASIGVNGSNILTKVWVLRCDANHTNSINAADITVIRAANGQAASGPYDPRDGNADGVINVADQRYCQRNYTPPLP